MELEDKERIARQAEGLMYKYIPNGVINLRSYKEECAKILAAIVEASTIEHERLFGEIKALTKDIESKNGDDSHGTFWKAMYNQEQRRNAPLLKWIKEHTNCTTCAGNPSRTMGGCPCKECGLIGDMPWGG